MMYGTCPWCGGSVGYGGSWWGFGLMILLGLLVIVGIVLLIMWAVRSSGAHAAHMPQQKDQALETARHRLATGEITAEQFEEIRRTLGG